MFFVGQEHITNQLRVILGHLDATREGASLLFRGPSGYGKTELATRCCNYLVGKDYQYCLGKNYSFEEDYWVHFIDEIHGKEGGFEELYPIIDSNKYVIILATNYDSLLPEPLINRCKSFIFSEYSNNNLHEIFKFHCHLRFTDRVINHIIEIAGRNPRVMIKTYASNLEMYFMSRRDELLNGSDEEIIETIDRIHGIKNGLDKTCREYLQVLHKLGGRASINLIASSLRLDLNTIKYSVEPILLFRGLIRITNKGRELC